jgi:serine/threonine-protein kinase
MGEVYRARDSKLDREVAIKVLRQDFASDPERLRRFQLEAHAASSLSHPNIITIYDIGTYKSTPYIAMEYVEGRTLRDLLKSGPLSSKKLLRFACQIAEGLTKAHSIGVVHRDLKPENLMITEDGYIKILDFGLAKLVSTPSASGYDIATIARGSTNPGVVLGSVGYMSPEQARGQPAGFRSDQFSFGSILYEMTTGQRAFEGSSAVQTLSAIIEKSPTPMANLSPEAPPPLRNIVERCLAKEPADRYLSTAELWQELEQLRESLPVISSQVEVHKRRADRRKWGLKALVGSGILFVLIVLAISISKFVPVEAPVATSETHAPHLAVATFKNLSGEAQNDFFSEGFTEAVMSRLMSLDGLHIVPLSEEIGAPFLLEGSVQKQGDRVRVTYRLMNLNDDVQLGGDVVDGRLEDIFDVQDRVAVDIADRLRESMGLTGGPLVESHPTDDVDAYRYYLEGRGYLRRFETGENLDMAIGLFDKALELDPDFALAYAGLGEAYWEKYDDTKQPEWVERATEATERAMKLDYSLSPVHTSLGTIYLGTGQLERAVASFDRAIALDEKSDDAYRGLASAYEAQGLMEKAEATYQRAIELRPDYWRGYSWLGVLYFRQGRYEDAVREFERVIELTPENQRAYTSLGGIYHYMGRFGDAEEMMTKSVTIKPTGMGFSNLGTLYFFQGKYEEAVPMMEKAVELNPNDYLYWGNLADSYRWAKGLETKSVDAYRKAVDLALKELEVNPKNGSVIGSLATYWAKLGQKDNALRRIDQALELASENANVVFDSLLTFEIVGERERALEALEQALEHGYSFEEISREPELSRLRDDPRYQDLFKRR